MPMKAMKAMKSMKSMVGVKAKPAAQTTQPKAMQAMKATKSMKSMKASAPTNNPWQDALDVLNKEKVIADLTKRRQLEQEELARRMKLAIFRYQTRERIWGREELTMIDAMMSAGISLSLSDTIPEPSMIMHMD